MLGDVLARPAVRPDRAGHVQLVAYAACAVLALRLRIPPDLHLGTLVSIVLLPITLAAVRRYRGGTIILALSTGAAAAGAVLSLVNAVDHSIGYGPMLSESLRIFGIGICIVTLLWARSVIGLHAVAFSYGAGALVSVLLTGAHADNPWKFSFSVPVVLIVLSLPLITRRIGVEFVAMLILAAASGLSDARSLAATLLIAAALLLIRRHPSRAASAWSVVAQIVVIGIGGYLALQAAILEGALGEEIQTRTAAQIQTSGSVLTGGRPELGATVALLTAHPFGFGTGTRPSFADIALAKEGMATLGYDPLRNGYVDRYMFGTKFEVHSLFGDLWLLGGIVGAALALALLIGTVGGMAHSIARGTASGVALFLGVRTIWDLLFSPIGTTFFTLILALALLLPERAPSTAREPAIRGG